MDEKDTTANRELNDEQLEHVAGGLTELDWNGKHYEYTGARGRTKDPAWDRCYLCPICGRPVHFGDWYRFYCDPCDKSWFYESELVPNLEGGMWREVSK